MPVAYQFDKKRFEAFLDAIFAILLTILVLEMKIPADKHESLNTFQQIKLLAPFLVSYLGTFMLLVGFWIDYHLLFVHITGITKRFMLLNMLFIFSISFAPFMTAFAGEHYDDSFAVALVSTTYFIMNLMFMFVFLYAKRTIPMDPAFWENNKKTALFSMIGIVGILVAIPLAYVNTYISFCIFLIIFGGHLVKRTW